MASARFYDSLSHELNSSAPGPVPGRSRALCGLRPVLGFGKCTYAFPSGNGMSVCAYIYLYTYLIIDDICVYIYAHEKRLCV